MLLAFFFIFIFIAKIAERLHGLVRALAQDFEALDERQVLLVQESDRTVILERRAALAFATVEGIH